VAEQFRRAAYTMMIAPRAGPLTTRERYRGCLIGGAVGDALGAPAEALDDIDVLLRYGESGITDFREFDGRSGAITDDTQLTLFTAEGLLRAFNRWSLKGYCNTPGVVHRAYLRWLDTQGISARGPRDPEVAPGWLIGVRELHARRAPDATCVGSLESGRSGAVYPPINDSRSSDVVMRGAPVGMLARVRDPFVLACQIGALTHGHPSAYLAAGTFAVMIRQLCHGASLREAIQSGIDRVEQVPSTGEVSAALRFALLFLADGTPPPTAIARLGTGVVAEEALAIAAYSALAANGDYARGVLLAVNNSRDRDTTGAIAGSLLGAALGVNSIPKHWSGRIELGGVITEIADDLAAAPKEEREWFDRYPPN
jgi:ADP-ribosylglycohydrolase